MSLEDILYTNVDPVETDIVHGYFKQETLELNDFLNKRCFVKDKTLKTARHQESIRNNEW